MSSFFGYCLRTGCLAVILMPTAIALLFAGIMIGKPKPCEITAPAPCKAKPYSSEVLLLPFFTFVPVLATIGWFTILRKEED